MKNAFVDILASDSTASGRNQFNPHIDSTLVHTASNKAPYLRLIRGGLSDNLTSSRPEKMIGEIGLQPPKSSARYLLQFVGTWVGDDLERCLEEVYFTRGEVEF